MDRQFLTSTSLTGLRPRGAGGRRVHDSWDQIDAYLRHALGADYADLFAEPVTGTTGEVFWYGAYEGDPTTFSDLSEDEREALKGTVRDRFETIQTHIKGLAESEREEERRLATVLDNALSVPEFKEGRDFLYSVGGNPVLINWGTRDDTPDPQTGVLAEFLYTKTPQTPEPPPQAPAPVAAPVAALAAVFPWWNLLWLLFALLVAANLYLLLAACAIGDPLGLRAMGIWADYCPAALAFEDENQRALEDERARTDALRHELARLDDSLLRAQPCRFPPPPEPEPEPIAPEPEPEPLPEPPPEPEPQAELDPCAEVGIDCGEGDVTITLRWDTDDDLDLIVVCPDGSRIKYNSKVSCGGRLDVDNRAQNPSDPGAENIYFEDGLPDPGLYRIEIENFADRTPGRSTPYRVIIRDKEGNVIEREGQIDGDRRIEIIDQLERR